MQPLSIIEYLNVVEQGGFRLFPGFKVAAMNAFCLERVEEVLHGGVIPAVYQLVRYSRNRSNFANVHSPEHTEQGLAVDRVRID